MIIQMNNNNSNNSNQGNNLSNNNYGYGLISNKLDSCNNIDALIEQTPKKIYSAFPLGINSSHLVYNDKENSFIKNNNDHHHDMPSADHFNNNYQIPSHYGYNQNNLHNNHNHHHHHSMDAYSYQPYQSYGIYYQQPYYGYDQYNQPQQQQQQQQQYTSYYDQSSYQPNLYNNNYFYNNNNNLNHMNNKTPLTGHKIQQNIILQQSENKLTGQNNYNGMNGMDEFGNKKEVTDFSLNNLVQQVNIPEYIPNFTNNNNHPDFPISNNLGQSAFTQPKSNNNNQSNGIRGKCSKSKSSMEQESEQQQQQQDESNKKSKITPSKRISKKKQRSQKQTPTNNNIQDNEDTFSNKTDLTLQSQLINASNLFNKSLSIQRQSTSEQTSDHIMAEEDQHNNNNTNQMNDKETLKGVSTNKSVRKNSSASTVKKAHRLSNVSASMISANTTSNTKVQDENYNMNILNIHVAHQNNLFAVSNINDNNSKLDMDQQQYNLIQQQFEQLNNDEDDDESESEDDDNNHSHNHNHKTPAHRYNNGENEQSSIKNESEENADSSQNSGQKGQNDSKPCNCRNSKCLKRYCDCFAAGLYCQAECKCEECHNKPEYEDERQKAIQKKKKRIKDAFLPVIQNKTHIKGCHCKNSHCQKKYCVCHQNGVLCSSLCQCVECENKIEAMKKDPSNQIQPPTPQSIHLINQISPSPLQLSKVKSSSQNNNNNLNLMNNPNKMNNNNLFAQQQLESPYNSSNKNSNHTNDIHTEVEFPSTIKKDSMGVKSKAFEEDFSTLKKPNKRKSYKSNENQKALSFFNEISPADNKYVVNKS